MDVYVRKHLQNTSSDSTKTVTTLLHIVASGVVFVAT